MHPAPPAPFVPVILLLLLSAASPNCLEEVKHFPGLSCVRQSLLAKGSTGSIYLVQDSSGVPRVLKVSPLFKRSRAERNALQRLKGERYITELIAWKEADGKMLLLLQYASRGNLFDFIGSTRYLQEPARIFEMFHKIFLGLRAIHRHHLVHADMKLANVVLDENFDPLIIDFDTAESVGAVDTPRGSLDYMSPEIVREYEDLGYTAFSPSQDLFSFGAMLYYAFKQHMPVDVPDYVYFDLMTFPIRFVRGDVQDFFDICFGLLQPASTRLDSDSALRILEEARAKARFGILKVDFTYSLQDYASPGELATDRCKIKMLVCFLVALVLLNLLTAFIVWSLVKRKKRLARATEPRLAHPNCSSSDAASSMMTQDS